jgi:hypothetical protein
MKIYRVVCYDNAHSFYHFGSRKEADAFARQTRLDYKDSEFDNATIEVETVEVRPTRAGIADALQTLVDYTCMNEH